MERLLGRSETLSNIAPLASVTGVSRFAFALAAAVMAAGIVTNERSYLIALPFIALCFTKTSTNHSPYRKSVMWVTTLLIMFGTVLGLVNGNDIYQIIIFSFPLTVFLLFVSLPGFGIALARSYRHLLVIGLFFTTIFFFYVKTANWSVVDDIMPGWTLTYSSNAAVSVWIYFMLPVCIVSMTGIVYRGVNVSSLAIALSGLLVLAMLILLNDTSAYVLAVIAVFGMYFLPQKLTKFFAILAILLTAGLIIDFLTIKTISRLIVLNTDGNVDDIGDMLRLIQVDYFVERAMFFGSGFGASHDFPFMISVARQQAQLDFPYASELPILNIIYNGGFLAGMWFIMVSWSFYRLVSAEGLKNDIEFMEIRLFGLGTAGVLIGSISNPYLFAPTSMMLLAVLVDLADTMSTLDPKRLNPTGEILPVRRG